MIEDTILVLLCQSGLGRSNGNFFFLFFVTILCNWQPQQLINSGIHIPDKFGI